MLDAFQYAKITKNAEEILSKVKSLPGHLFFYACDARVLII